jgi:hypothetical protein
MLSVHQHWDPLKVCLVGKSYPPEFYSFIKNPKVRSVMERIAMETEEDYQKLITLLEKFKVKVIRMDMSDNPETYFNEYAQRYYAPPMCPRDYCGMYGNRFFVPNSDFGELLKLYEKFLSCKDVNLKKKYFEKLHSEIDLSDYIKGDYSDEQIRVLLLDKYNTLKDNSMAHFTSNTNFDAFKSAKEYVFSCGNEIIKDNAVNAAVITRVGKDLIHGVVHFDGHVNSAFYNAKIHFKDYKNHIVRETAGHTDSAFCPVKPGLIISLNRPYAHQHTFPGWEVVSLPDQSWAKVSPFLHLKEKNKGKWWVPGEEYNDDFTDFVETWLRDWVYYVEETVFDVNILVIDENNVVCNNYNKDVFDAFERHNITPHIINFRHRYFWDGGLHCITSDLDREGTQKDFFPSRKKNLYIYDRKKNSKDDRQYYKNVLDNIKKQIDK